MTIRTEAKPPKKLKKNNSYAENIQYKNMQCYQQWILWNFLIGNNHQGDSDTATHRTIKDLHTDIFDTRRRPSHRHICQNYRCRSHYCKRHPWDSDTWMNSLHRTSQQDTLKHHHYNNKVQHEQHDDKWRICFDRKESDANGHHKVESVAKIIIFE